MSNTQLEWMIRSRETKLEYYSIIKLINIDEHLYNKISQLKEDISLLKEELRERKINDIIK